MFDADYPDAAARLRFTENLAPRLRALPGVSAVAFASTLPLMGYERQKYARVGDDAVVERFLHAASGADVELGRIDVVEAVVKALRDRHILAAVVATAPLVRQFAVGLGGRRDDGHGPGLADGDVDRVWMIADRDR